MIYANQLYQGMQPTYRPAATQPVVAAPAPAAPQAASGMSPQNMNAVLSAIQGIGNATSAYIAAGTQPVPSMPIVTPELADFPITQVAPRRPPLA